MREPASLLRRLRLDAGFLGTAPAVPGLRRLYETGRRPAWNSYGGIGIFEGVDTGHGDRVMPLNLPPAVPAPFAAGPWLIPLFWLAVLLVAFLLWLLS